MAIKARQPAVVYNAVEADSLPDDNLLRKDKSVKGAQVRAGSVRRIMGGMLGAGLLLGAGAAGLVSSSVPAHAQINLDRSEFYADPSKYALYGCPNIEQVRPGIVARLAQLEGLIAKAKMSPGGGLIAELAYSDEYKANQGDLRNIDARARELNCPPPQPSKAAPAPQERKRPARH